MTDKLSSKFFGDKKYKQEHHQHFLEFKTLSEEDVSSIFVPYSNQLHNQMSKDNSCSKLTIFAEFINENLKKFQKWEFQQVSSWIEIAAHVFEHSFQNCLNKKESFDYFGEVLVRHSLFRPPHSIAVFTYEQSQQIMEFWLGTFSRFYEEYSLCFALELNQIIETICPPFPVCEQSLLNGKEIPRESLGEKLIEQLGVTLKKVPQNSEQPQAS